jgi:hypothetical protein
MRRPSSRNRTTGFQPVSEGESMGSKKPPILDYRHPFAEPSLRQRVLTKLDLRRVDSSAAKTSIACSLLSLVGMPVGLILQNMFIFSGALLLVVAASVSGFMTLLERGTNKTYIILSLGLVTVLWYLLLYCLTGRSYVV